MQIENKKSCSDEVQILINSEYYGRVAKRSATYGCILGAAWIVASREYGKQAGILSSFTAYACWAIPICFLV